MAISFVAAGAVATGASPSVALPTGWSQGNLLLVTTISGSLVTTPSGWTRIGNTSAPGIFTYYKIAGASETAVTLTGAGTSATSVMVAYSGVLSNDVNATQKSGSSTSASTNTLTTTNNYDVIISIFGIASGGSSTLSTPTGTTSRSNTSATISFGGLLIVDEIQNTSGTSTSRISTLSPSNTWWTEAFSFSPTTGDFFRMF